MAGVRTVPGQLVNAVRVLGASRARLVRDVWLPGSLPGIVVGVRMGIAYGWRALIAGEMVVGTGGIGYLLFQARWPGAGSFDILAASGRNREARRHREAGPAHRGQTGPFAAEQVLARRIAFGRAAAEGEDVPIGGGAVRGA